MITFFSDYTGDKVYARKKNIKYVPAIGDHIIIGSMAFVVRWSSVYSPDNDVMYIRIQEIKDFEKEMEEMKHESHGG